MENTLAQTTVNAIKDWKAVQKELGPNYCFFNHLINIKTGHHIGTHMLIDVYSCYLKREKVAKQRKNFRILNKEKYSVNKHGMLTDTSLQVNENA